MLDEEVVVATRRVLPVWVGARERLGIEPEALTVTGDEIDRDLARAQELAAELEASRRARGDDVAAGSAGSFLALRLLARFFFSVLDAHREETRDRVLARALEWLSLRHGEDRVHEVLGRFASLYLPQGFLEPAVPPEGGVAAAPPAPADEDLLAGLILLLSLNENPAARPWRELFDDAQLEAETAYREVLGSLEEFFAHEPGFGPDGLPLTEVLRAPARVAPDSLAGQLRFLLRATGQELPALQGELLYGLDVLAEENRPIFHGPGGGPPGPGPAEPLVYAAADLDEERFTADRHWMPELVLLAKNVFVWLDQLSQRYGEPISRLDEIPDAELDRLAAWSFTGLWLIGIWERSPASQRIKQLCGNPEAAASAYSLDEPVIAVELGGDAALDQLRRRAWRRGIRLGCDMVPNHMGIDSRWVIERPELFLEAPHCPFQNYRFSGPDLSPDPRVGIFLEDHYYDRTDAAVVFKRVDRETGDVRWIYHGNDGTGMPWNDTAQLDYLNPETREAVIVTILEAAKRFPVIRFDAAMTLARRHIQRLWHPEPGKAGDIPSRAAFAVSPAEFQRRMPLEFWREVVDRLAEEAPDTLLLAEAFWLMESYFVRTLGMHRVYHSAFMHMLRDEENAKLRTSIKNTLEFQPEILQRFVNYVTTPDEDPAALQLGKGDKYFGICTLMVTLPGLPLFGHGQFEGLREKYGMEYRRAYAREEPDTALVARHERQIVPLLARRKLFAQVAEFRLFDFTVGPGTIDENVFAFTNGVGEERTLVVVHNRAGLTRGRVARAVPFARDGEGPAVRTSLAEALGLKPRRHALLRFRDLIAGREYLVELAEVFERGLPLELGPYEHRVLLDFQLLDGQRDTRYRELARALGGRGVPSLQDAYEDLHAQAVQAPVARLLEPRVLASLLDSLGPATGPEARGRERDHALASFELFARGVLAHLAPHRAPAADEEPELAEPWEARGARALGAAMARLLAALDDSPPPPAGLGAPRVVGAALLAWASLAELGGLAASSQTGGPDEEGVRSRVFFDAWRLDQVVRRALLGLGASPAEAAQLVALVAFLLRRRSWAAAAKDLPALLADRETQRLLSVNDFDGERWFVAEGMAALRTGLGVAVAVELAGAPAAAQLAATLERLARAELAAEHRFDRLLALLAPSPAEGSAPAVAPDSVHDEAPAEPSVL